jgi:hypothetical protein
MSKIVTVQLEWKYSPETYLEDFDGTRKSLHAGQPALLTGLNDAVKTFILLSYEHRV